MGTEIKVLGKHDVEDVMKEIEQAFFHIPFGNTAYQTKVFVLDNSITPERRYRTLGLQLITSLNNMRDAIFDKKLKEIQRQEDLEKLNSGELSTWDRQRLEIKIQREDYSEAFSDKLLNDGIQELNLLYSEFKKLPKYTREQFEKAEENYFIQSLERQSRGITGPVDSLINIREDKPAMAEFLEKLPLIENLNDEVLEKLRLEMPNQLEKVQERERQKAIELSKEQKMKLNNNFNGNN